MEAVALIIMNDKFEYLFLDRNYEPLGYGLVAGYIDEGEDGITAIVRECKEEIGVDLNKSSVMYIGQVESSNGIEVGLFCLDHYFEGEVQLSHEHKNYIFTKNLDNINLAGRTKDWIRQVEMRLIGEYK